MSSQAGHYDDWHDDVMEDRLVGMSVNLSPHGYGGGQFRLRGRESEEILAEIANTGFGDALIFRISLELQHRVSDVEGALPKTAFAGWFRPAPVGFLEDVVLHARGQRKEGISVLKT